MVIKIKIKIGVKIEKFKHNSLCSTSKVRRENKSFFIQNIHGLKKFQK